MIKITDDLADMHVVVIDGHTTESRELCQCMHSAGFRRVSYFSDAHEVHAQLATLEPDVVCLDLDLPGRKGTSLLTDLRTESPHLVHVPILVFTSDQSTGTRQWALELGANDFIGRPLEMIETLLRIRNFLRTRLLSKELEMHSLNLDKDFRRRTANIFEAADDCLWRLARASEYRDDDTGEHTMRVGHMSADIAIQLGVDKEEVEMIRRAAPLHDIGKIGIPDSVLLKPGRLSTDEMDVMKTHVKIGASLLAGSTSRLMILAEQIALTHHEKWDGSGYLLGLNGDDIPLPGRIVAVADVFDALTHDRPYKQAWPTDQAIKEISKLSGSHFDPKVVDAFLAVVEVSGEVRV